MSLKPFTVEDPTGKLVTLAGYAITPFVVGQDGNSPYTNIQDAINAAYLAKEGSKDLEIEGDGKAKTVLIKDGLYQENLIFKAGVFVSGIKPFDTKEYNMFDNVQPERKATEIPGVVIEGSHTFLVEDYKEYEIKNIMFIPRWDSVAPILLYPTSVETEMRSHYRISNCLFVSDFLLLGSDLTNPNGFDGGWVNITHQNEGSNGDRYYFNNCLFFSNTHSQDINLFYYQGAFNTILSLDNCVFKNDSSLANIVLDGSIDGSFPQVKAKNCSFIELPIHLASNNWALLTNFKDCLFECIQSGNVSPIYIDNDIHTVSFINCEINAYFKPMSGEGQPYNIDTTGTIIRNGNSESDYIEIDKAYNDKSFSPIYFYGFSTEQQVATAVNIPQPISINTWNRSLIDVELNSEPTQTYSRIKIKKNGYYNLQFSCQLDRISGSGIASVNIFLRKNGVIVPKSNTIVTISGNANSAKTVAAWNFVFGTEDNSYYELMWSTSNTDIVLYTQAGTTEIPETPSVILTVYKIK